MGKVYEGLSPEHQTWLRRQKVLFVATAPLASDGHVNCSPKGCDTFRVLNEREVAYLDLTGSGIETVAHIQENRRIVIMTCAFLRRRREDHPGCTATRKWSIRGTEIFPLCEPSFLIMPASGISSASQSTA